METGAFGSGKAGSSVDPLVYLRKPSVVFRIGALVSLTYHFVCFPLCGATSWDVTVTTM